MIPNVYKAVLQESSSTDLDGSTSYPVKETRTKLPSCKMMYQKSSQSAERQLSPLPRTIQRAKALYTQQTQRVNRAGTQIIFPQGKATGKKLEGNKFKFKKHQNKQSAACSQQYLHFKDCHCQDPKITVSTPEYNLLPTGCFTALKAISYPISSNESNSLNFSLPHISIKYWIYCHIRQVLNALHHW